MAGEYMLPEGNLGFKPRRGMPEGKAGLQSRRNVSEDAETVSPTLFEKFFRVFIVIAVLCLGGEFVWLLGITPFRPFSGIEISGSAALGRDEILDAAGITPSSSYFSTNASTAEKALASLSSLESARVFKHFPDRLQIVVEGRKAVATALASVNTGPDARTVPVLIDSQGVVFQIGWNENNESLPHLFPVVSGFVIDNPVAGMKLPAMFDSFFAELEKIENSAPELLAAVSELKINPKSYDGFDLVLYPVYKKIKVRIPELNEDLLRYTLLMVDVLAAKEPGIDTLDFRGGIASYIPKEASSEQ